MKIIFPFLLYISGNILASSYLCGQTDTARIGSQYRLATSELDQLNFKEARKICSDLLDILHGKDSFSLASRIHVLDLQGSMFRHESRYVEAKAAYSEALLLATNHFPDNSVEVALAYYQMAWINEQSFDMEGWKSYLDSASVFFQKAFAPDDCWNGRIWQGRARMNYYNFGPPDTTLFFLRKATMIYQHCPGGALKNEFDLAKIYYDVFLSLRQFDSAEYYLKLQIDYTNTQEGPMWDIQRAWMELTKAHLYRLNGQYEKAISYYQYAKTLFEKADRDTVPLLSCDIYTALCLNGIGKYQDALAYFDKLTILASTYTKITWDMAGLIYEGISSSYASSGKPDSAVIYARKSIRAFHYLIQPDNPKLLHLYLTYGSSLLKLQQYHEADSILQFAFVAAQQAFGNNHPLPIQINLERCMVTIRSGDFRTSKIILDSISQNKDLEHYPELAYKHIITSAELLIRETGQNKLNSSTRTELISLLYEAIQKFREIRNQYVTEEARARSVIASIEELHAFIPFLFEYYTLEPNNDLFEIMLQISETHRGLILSEAMVQSDAYHLAGIPPDLQRAERNIKSGLFQIRKQLEQEYLRSMPKKEYIRQLLARQIENQTEFDELIETFQNKYPAYYRAKFAHGAVRLNEIQENLKPDEVLAEYLQVSDDIYVFAMRHDTMNIYKTKNGILLMDKAMEFIRVMSHYNTDPDRQMRINMLGYELYQGLVYPYESLLTASSSLILIPDKSLFYFPFELLQSEKAASGKKNAEHFLIYLYPIQYQSSLLLWMDQFQNKNKPVRHMLTVSPSFEMNENDLASRSGLGALNYAEDESKQIYQSWGGTWLSKEKASKSNFIRQASRSDMIHLATHATADDRTGVFSWLAFSTSTSDSLLYLDEIYGLSLDARMVVLSGCETGIGPLQTGEGLISLSRAFSYAGAESIITTLWPVHDAATSLIMTSFYKYLKEGKSKDKALQLAKLEYLLNITDPLQADPYYWAGFIAMGDMSPVRISEGIPYIWWWLGLIVAGLGLGWMIYKYNKRSVALKME